MTTTVDRRKFLTAAGVTAVGAAAAGVGGELLLGKHFHTTPPTASLAPSVPKAKVPKLQIQPMTPLPADETLNIAGLSPFYTPERGFLPGRHGPGPAAGRGGHLAAAHPRHGRQPGDRHVRPAHPAAHGRARCHFDLRLGSRGRRLHRQRPLAGRAPGRPASRGRNTVRCRPDRHARRQGDDHRRGHRAGHGWPDVAARGGHERPAAAPGARIPGAGGGARTVRLRVRDQMGGGHGTHHLRRVRRLLGEARLVPAGADQDGIPHRRAEAPQHRSRRPGDDRRRRLGPASRHRGRRGVRRRRSGTTRNSPPRTPSTPGASGTTSGTPPPGRTCCRYGPPTRAATPRLR